MLIALRSTCFTYFGYLSNGGHVGELGNGGLIATAAHAIDLGEEVVEVALAASVHKQLATTLKYNM